MSFIESKTNIHSPKQSLSQRVVVGGFWVLALKIAVKMLDVIRLIFIARLLKPNDFGIMGVAMLTMAALEMFS